MHPLLAPTTIGRGLENAIVIQELTASRSHACVSFEGDTWLVEDLGSTNGVLVGGKRIKKVPLHTGDTFQIGDLTFRLVEMEHSGNGPQLSQTVQVLSASIETIGNPRRASGSSPDAERLQEAIAAIPFFTSLGETELEKLASTSTLHIFQPGEAVIRQGEPGRSVFLILHGRVRVFTTDYKGKDLELAVLGVSQFFGEMSFLTGQPRSSHVEAVENSVLIELSYTTMHRLAQENPQVKETLVNYYRDRMESTRKKREGAGAPDRRQDDRVKKRVPVTFTVVSQTEVPDARNNKPYSALSRDISMSGAVVECVASEPKNLGPGTQLRLQLELPPSGEQVRAVGTVRRVQPASGERKGALFALEFKAMPAEEIQKLKKFLHGEHHLAPES